MVRKDQVFTRCVTCAIMPANSGTSYLEQSKKKKYARAHTHTHLSEESESAVIASVVTRADPL